MSFKRVFSILCCGILALALALPVQAQGAPSKLKFSKEAAIPQLYYSAFPDLSSDGKTIVALDAKTWDYMSGSHKCGILVSNMTKSGKWTTPVVLAETGIKDSIPYMETHPVISGDGKTIVYIGVDPETNTYRLFESILDASGTWSSSKIIDTVPAGSFNIDVSINEDGTVVSYGQGGGGFFGGSTHLYVIRKSADVWQTPEELRFTTTDYSHSSGKLDAVGDTMILTITTSNSDLYVTDYVNGAWTEPLKLTSCKEDSAAANSSGSNDFTYFDAINSSISGDGNTLFYYIRTVKNSVVKDRSLFWATRASSAEPWSTPALLSKDESSQLTMDSPVALSADGKSLCRIRYYTTKYTDGSSYLSGSKLLYQTRTGNRWSTPAIAMSTAADYAETPVMSANGKGIVVNHFSSLSYVKRIK